MRVRVPRLFGMRKVFSTAVMFKMVPREREEPALRQKREEAIQVEKERIFKSEKACPCDQT